MKPLKSEKRKLLLYGGAGLVCLLAVWGILRRPAGRTVSESLGISQQSEISHAPRVKGSHASPEGPKNVVDDGPGHGQKDSTPTLKLKLVPTRNASFVAIQATPAPDNKLWNSSRDHYLVRNSVWYELHDRNGKQLLRLPSYINVDAGGNPETLDKFGQDIAWRWAGNSAMIGVQQIVRPNPAADLKGLAAEFPETHPDAARIYMIDVAQPGTVYELMPPEVPPGKVVRLEGVSEDGRVLLAAVSPKAYNQGDELKNEPDHYQELGVYEYTQ